MGTQESLDAIRDRLDDCLDKYPTLSAARLFQFSVPPDVIRRNLGRPIAEYTQTLNEEPPLTSNGQTYREVLGTWLYFPGVTSLPSGSGNVLSAATVSEHNSRCLGNVQSVFGEAAAMLCSSPFQKTRSEIGVTNPTTKWGYWLDSLFTVAAKSTGEIDLQLFDETKAIITDCQLTCDNHNWGSLENDEPEEDKVDLLCECDRTESRSGWVLVLDPNVFAASIQLVDYLRAGLATASAAAESPEQLAGDDNGASDDGTKNPAGLDSLKPAVKKAWASWKLAETNHAEKPQDRAAYDWLAEQEDDFFVGELPAFDTWQRYVRQARKSLGKSKNQPRAGRVAGGSVVKESEI